MSFYLPDCEYANEFLFNMKTFLWFTVAAPFRWSLLPFFHGPTPAAGKLKIITLINGGLGLPIKFVSSFYIDSLIL